jgi:hypothetical protein
LPVVSFWHGPMTWLERLCFASFVRQGHPVHLYSYNPIVGLPEGVELRDAAELIPRDRLIFYKGSGTPGIFADFFRVVLQRERRGIWVDADVYCVRPIVDPPEYLFGWEQSGSVNSAVLLLPPDSPLLDDLLTIFERGPRPIWEPYLPLLRRLEVAARRLAGDRVAPEYMQYGATGPMALTYYIKKRGLIDRVQPREVFYPVPYRGIPALMQPGSTFNGLVSSRTIAVHLWRSQLTERGQVEIELPALGSALFDLCVKDGVLLTA